MRGPLTHPIRNSSIAMNHLPFRAVFACLTVLALSGHAQAQSQIPVVQVVSTQALGLVQNGEGIRSQGATDLYRAALHLSQPASSMEQMLGSGGAKRLELRMLHAATSDELGKLFTRGIEKNNRRQELSRLIPGLIRMGEIFSQHKRLNAGDVLTIDWIPEQGTVISIKGVVQGAAIPDPAFFGSLLSIWLGKDPVDNELKSRLLGKSRT